MDCGDSLAGVSFREKGVGMSTGSSQKTVWKEDFNRVAITGVGVGYL